MARKTTSEQLTLGWRDGTVVKSTGYSFQGPRFDSQQPIAVNANLHGTGLQRHQICMSCADRHADQTLIHRKINTFN